MPSGEEKKALADSAKRENEYEDYNSYRQKDGTDKKQLQADKKANNSKLFRSLTRNTGTIQYKGTFDEK